VNDDGSYKKLLILYSYTSSLAISSRQQVPSWRFSYILIVETPPDFHTF
jgi:hypothetical protein